MPQARAIDPLKDIRNEETIRLLERREQLFRRLREVYADSRIRSFKFDGKWLIISCRTLPAQIVRPLVVGGYMAFWIHTTEAFNTSRGDQGSLYWPEPRIREDISRLCRIRQIPPDEVLEYLANNHFVNCVGISFIANTVMVEVQEMCAKQYRRSLKISPESFTNLPFDIRYHNGPLPNTPERLPKRSRAIPSNGTPLIYACICPKRDRFDVSNICSSNAEGETPSLYLEMTNHKKYLCPWDETSYQLAGKDKIPTESLDDMGLIISERWRRAGTMDGDTTTRFDPQLGREAKAIKPVMINSRDMVLGEHSTMRVPSGVSKKAVLYGRRLRFEPLKKGPGPRVIKTRHDIYLSNSLIKRPNDPLERPIAASAVFTRAFAPAQTPGPSSRLGQVGGILEYRDLAERKSGLCFLSQLLYVNPCDNLISFGCYMTVAEPPAQASEADPPRKRQKRDEQLPFHSSRFL